jgi:mannose-1-phosphate guanylyltransferase
MKEDSAPAPVTEIRDVPDAARHSREVDVVPPPPPAATEPDHGAVATFIDEEPQAEALGAADSGLWAIVLAGGIGSRFWPLSTPEHPKQVLALVGARPLIAETVARLDPLVPAERVLVLTSRDIADTIHAAIPQIPDENMLIEPRPLGTAAALAWGASEVARRAGPETIFCCLHADLAVGFPDLFRQIVSQSTRVAATLPTLVAVGVQPTRPETGFGYLALRGSSNGPGALGALPVERFVEKPGPILAETLLAHGALWNTGIFVARARIALDALARHTRELAPGLDALERRDFDTFAGSIQSISIERGLLERCGDLVAMVGDFQWDDVGTWASLRRARELDDTGNGALGRAHFVESTGNVVHVERGAVVLYGCSGMLVVTLDGLTFVTPLDRAVDLRPLLDALPAEMRNRPVG